MQQYGQWRVVLGERVIWNFFRRHSSLKLQTYLELSTHSIQREKQEWRFFYALCPTFSFAAGWEISNRLMNKSVYCFGPALYGDWKKRLTLKLNVDKQKAYSFFGLPQVCHLVWLSSLSLLMLPCWSKIAREIFAMIKPTEVYERCSVCTSKRGKYRRTLL